MLASQLCESAHCSHDLPVALQDDRRLTMQLYEAELWLVVRDQHPWQSILGNIIVVYYIQQADG